MLFDVGDEGREHPGCVLVLDYAEDEGDGIGALRARGVGTAGIMVKMAVVAGANAGCLCLVVTRLVAVTEEGR